MLVLSLGFCVFGLPGLILGLGWRFGIRDGLSLSGFCRLEGAVGR